MTNAGARGMEAERLPRLNGFLPARTNSAAADAEEIAPTWPQRVLIDEDFLHRAVASITNERFPTRYVRHELLKMMRAIELCTAASVGLSQHFEYFLNRRADLHSSDRFPHQPVLLALGRAGLEEKALHNAVRGLTISSSAASASESAATSG